MDIFLIKYCPADSFELPVIKIDYKCISDRDDLYVDFTYFILENVFS
jgi:hypothetical protein